VLTLLRIFEMVAVCLAIERHVSKAALCSISNRLSVFETPVLTARSPPTEMYAGDKLYAGSNFKCDLGSEQIPVHFYYCKKIGICRAISYPRPREFLFELRCYL
jgi:hypothetical protein